MKTIERLHEYNGYLRTETKIEERELFEDLLLLSKLSEDAAKIAYAVVRGPENNKKDAEVNLKESFKKIKDQYEICLGYETEVKTDA